MGATRTVRWDGERWQLVDQTLAVHQGHEAAEEAGFWPSVVLAGEAVIICGVFSALLYLLTKQSSYQQQYVELLSLLPILLVEKVYRLLHNQARAARQGTRPWLLETLSSSLIFAVLASLPFVGEQGLRTQIGVQATTQVSFGIMAGIFFVAGTRLAIRKGRYPVLSLIILAAVGAAVTEPLSLASEAAQGIPAKSAIVHSESLGYAWSIVFLAALFLPAAMIGYSIGPFIVRSASRVWDRRRAATSVRQQVNVARGTIVRFSLPDWVRRALSNSALIAAAGLLMFWVWVFVNHDNSSTSADPLDLANLLGGFAIAVLLGIVSAVIRRPHSILGILVTGYGALLIYWAVLAVLGGRYTWNTVKFFLENVSIYGTLFVLVILLTYGVARLIAMLARAGPSAAPAGSPTTVSPTEGPESAGVDRR